MPYNPVRDTADILVDREGVFVYVYLPGKFEVKVIDSQLRKVVRAIKSDEEVIAFNEEFGNKQLNEFQEGVKKRGTPIDFVADFPDFFPFARELFISAENKLAVRRWTAKPNQMEKNTIFDAKGNTLKTTYNSDSARRILLVHDGFAYINAFNAETDAAYIIKAPVASIDKVVAANPLDFSLEEPRMMVMEH